MRKNRLGKSSIVVSDICMGTMTFGCQADEKASFRIMDTAYDAGVDFYDTAEMYPVPPDAKYVGDTELIVGRWLKTKDRDSVILASKVAGPSHGWIAPDANTNHQHRDTDQQDMPVDPPKQSSNPRTGLTFRLKNKILS